MIDHGLGLGHEVVGVEHLALRVLVDLATDEDQRAAAQAVLVREMDQPVPVSLGPGVASLGQCVLLSG